ncbi:DNA polymerase III subunit gamma/tau [Schlegelella sp. S2-27]|uniref:DNA polymerase III subunit gamma/tau n=1 Tax=Caldimonas mangrovi TaxID=2944811 RepID=A0ABT0YQF1_9BURK|nr:DNA polymerase III subunit gamma/tau [Caldimonas mangrovi]MCM5680964.1 DNA polymerase III subunit gamma/tau [Caldimonas mangrovi]
MSYLVLARKYRPRTFEEMVGQEHVVQALSNALTQQRLHHAYLFTGTRGVGKTTVSRILAKSLNCQGEDGQGGITATPCGVCQACRDIDAGRFVDYVELDAASNRGVEEISQLLDQAVYKPVVGRFKVYMIDEVHMLSNTAFNAMLKTLEEPPEYLKFVLATTDPQKVPVTVLSRCLQFNLRPMAPETVLEHLQRVLEAERIEAETGALRLLSRAARGSMRDALSLADQAIAFGSGVLQEAGVRQMLGAVDRGHVYRLIESLAAGDGAAVVGTVHELRAQGLSAPGALEEMATVLQQMAVLQVVPDAADESDPENETLQRLAGLLLPEETQLLYSIALHGRNELGLAPDEYSGMTMALLRMLAFKPVQGGAAKQASAALQRTPHAATRVAARPAIPVPARAAAPQPAAREAVRPVAAAPTAVRAPARAAASQEPPPREDEPPQAPASAPRAQPPVPQPITPAPVSMPASELGDRWQALVRQMCERELVAALVRELAMQSQLLTADEPGDTTPWRLRVERETLASDSARTKLEAALSEVLGRPLKLALEVGATEDTPARRDAVLRALRQREAEQAIQNDPLVVSLMQQFSTARIVPGSIRPV